MNEQKKIFVFIGPPGSGKGSLAHLCSQHLGWEQLSTGNLCRKHIAERTALGKEIDFAIKSGNLVSDRLIVNMVEDWLIKELKSKKAVILDGFPRTAGQAQALNMLLDDESMNLGLVVVRLNIDDAALIARLSNRVICQNKDCQAVYSLSESSLLRPSNDMVCDICGSPLGRRKDDDPSTVKDRLAIYRNHEKELLDFYRNVHQPILELNAQNSIDEVFNDFKRLIAENV